MADVVVSSFTEVSTVINKLLRRTAKSAVGLLSPTIFTAYAPTLGGDGLIGKFLVPCAATLTSVSLSVPGATTKAPVEAVMEITSGGTVSAQTVQLTKSITTLQLSISVVTGDILAVRLVDTTKEDVLVSALLTPVIGEYNVLRYLYDTLDAEATNISKEANA